MALKTRKPTGKPPWPVVLIAGMQKAGKSYAAAQASASPLIDRTFWFTQGEDDPDEYGLIEGARFEIVEYDGTFRDLYLKMKEAAAEPMDPARPHLWVLDSGSKLWELISDMAQVEKNRRWQNKQAKYGKSTELPADGLRIDMDLWNIAKSRWKSILELMVAHQGPSIITARLEKTSVIDDRTGEPTKEKVWKVQAEKNLAFDVGAVVEMHARNDVYLTGVRSLRMKLKDARTPFPNFTVHELWTKLGLAESVGQRFHTEATGEKSLAADDLIIARRNELFAQLREVARAAGVTPDRVEARWLEDYGHDIRVTTDLGALELMIDDLRGRATRLAATQNQETAA